MISRFDPTFLKNLVLVISILSLLGGIGNLIIINSVTTRSLDIFSITMGIVVPILGIAGTLNGNVNCIFTLASVYYVGSYILLPSYCYRIIMRAIEQSAPSWHYIVMSVIIIICFVVGVCFSKIIQRFYDELLHKKFSSSNIDATVEV